MEILENALRTIAFFFDNIVYSLIPMIYKLFIYLSDIDIFGNSDPIQQVVSNVYVLLGIFMLFKVSFSLLQYIVDPSAFSDSSKGFGKLITNVMVALVLLITVPYIFDGAMKLQSIILQSNVIGELILGESMSSENDDGSKTIDMDKVNEMAKDVQFMMYGAFYSLNLDSVNIVGDDQNQDAIFYECKDSNGVFGSVSMATEPCLQALEDELGGYDYADSNGVTLASFFKYKENETDTVIQDNRDFGAFTHLLWWKVDGDYVIKYLPFISAIAGIYVVFLLVSFSVDLALRAIKLCFLQMIAPIAIVSYIDPAESIKESKLNKWAHESFNTYVSLFIRLATMFFVILLISVLADTVLAGGEVIPDYVEKSYNMWIYLFLIIGAFMFAKQVPNIIDSIFGIKGSGDLHLNPFKNEGAAMITGGVVGAGVGGIASSIASAKTASITGDNRFSAGLSGFAKGTLGGVIKGKKWDGKGFSSLISTPLGVSGDIARYQAAKHGTKFGDRAGAMFNEAIGAPQKADIMKTRIENADRFTKLFGAVDSGMSAKMSKLKDISQFTSNNSATNATNFKKISDYNYLKAQLDAATQRGDAATIAAIQNGSYSDGVFTSSAKFSDYEDDAKQTMYDMIINNEVKDDSEIQSIKSNIDAMKRVGKENASSPEFASVNSNIYVTDASGTSMSKMKNASKAVATAKTVTENSDEYENSKAAADAIKSNRMFDFVTKK